MSLNRNLGIRRARSTERAVLVDIWLRSVRATHDFLTEDDLASLIPPTRDYLMSEASELWVVCDEAGAPFGFMGTAGSEVASLFIAPEALRRGARRLQLAHASALHGALTVAVNEQNAGARRFYEAMGFVVERRTELDDEGRPFPLLYMRSSETAPA
jgi:putative acetyltransferase